MVTGAALHRREDALEVASLEWQELLERLFPSGEFLGEDHLAHGTDAILLEEHVLGSTEADADGAEVSSALERRRGRRHWYGPSSVPARPPNLRTVARSPEIFLGTSALDGLRASPPRWRRRWRSDVLAGPSRLPFTAATPLARVDVQGTGPRDAALAPATGDDGGVRRHATRGGENAGGGVHAIDVLRGGLLADEDDRFHPCGSSFDGLLSAEGHGTTRGSSGRGGKAGAEDLGLLLLCRDRSWAAASG